LSLAYIDNKMVGYIGVLPDFIFLDDKPEKIFWISGYWVHQDYRGKKIAQTLLKNCIEDCNYRAIYTNYSPYSKRAFDKSGHFIDLKKNKGIRLYIRSDLQTILPPKKTIYQRNKSLLKIIDWKINIILDLRLFFKKVDIDLTKYKFVTEIDFEMEQFINQKTTNYIFQRGANELKWIIDFPWIKDIELDIDNTKNRYNFSSFSNDFSNIIFKLYNSENQIAAVVFLTKRDSILNIPYLFCNAEVFPEIERIINFLIKTQKISTFTCYNEEFANYLQKNNTFAIAKKSISRHYVITKFFEDRIIFENTNIQDGDGDCVFT
jgi:GNAT superfamily N-acetyltransferase